MAIGAEILPLIQDDEIHDSSYHIDKTHHL